MSGLELRGLRKAYPEFTLSIDCTVREGSLTTLLGPSGCGKSTALSVITGIEAPSAGQIILAGTDITDLPPWERNIALVFQDYTLFPHMDVSHNIAYGLKIRKMPRRDIEGRSAELLELIGLAGYERRRVHELSGGEQQRVALARALAPQPKLLLLDEPLSALDAKLRIRLRTEIKRIQRELGVTTIYVTHDQEEALDISDEIIVMNNGKIEQSGTPEDIYRNPESLFCGSFIGASSVIPVSELYEDQQSSLHSREGLLFFRPEDVHLHGERPCSPCITFSGSQLTRKAYRGFYYEYFFSWKGHTVRSQGDGSLQEQQAYTLAVSADRCLILPEG